MTGPEKHMRNVVVRHMSDVLNEQSCALIPDVFRRAGIRVNVRTGLERSEVAVPGIDLAGGPELEQLARQVGRLILKIMCTDEILWLAINAHADFGGWTIECVPLVEWLKLSTPTDTQVLKASGIDPETGQPR